MQEEESRYKDPTVGLEGKTAEVLKTIIDTNRDSAMNGYKITNITDYQVTHQVNYYLSFWIVYQQQNNLLFFDLIGSVRQSNASGLVQSQIWISILMKIQWLSPPFYHQVLEV